MDHSVIAGFLDFLEKKPNVVNVSVHAGKPSNLTQLTAWEESSGCHLPDDLKQFYLTNDGLTLQWCYNDGATTLSLGRINICCLSHLKPVGEQLLSSTGYLSSLDSADTCSSSSWPPTFGGPDILFSLDYCPSYGHICLVYSHEKGVGRGIWLLDLSLDWHYLCASFSDYLRLAIAHLGLVQWPYALTPLGLSPQYERWFHQFIPKRLALDHSEAAAAGAAPKGPVIAGSSDENTNFTNSIDVTKLMQLKSLKDRRSRHQSGTTNKKQTGGRI